MVVTPGPWLYEFTRASRLNQDLIAKAFWERRHLRKHDVDPPSSPRTMAAQRAAITAWRDVRRTTCRPAAAVPAPAGRQARPAVGPIRDLWSLIEACRQSVAIRPE